MRNIREGGMSIICPRCSLTGTRFFSSTAKTGVVLEIMDGSLTPSPFQGEGWGGGHKNNAPMIGAFGVPSKVELVFVHLPTTNVPLLDLYEYYHWCWHHGGRG